MNILKAQKKKKKMEMNNIIPKVKPLLPKYSNGCKLALHAIFHQHHLIVDV